MTPFQTAVGELNRIIGPTLIALACASRDRGIAGKWMSGERTPLREDERRVYFMINILRTVTEHESEDTARAWFIGANCDDMTTSPAEIIREGRLVEAEISASQLMSDSYT